MNETMKFKIPEGKATISIIPNNTEPPFMHYAPQDAFITRQTFCILCWHEEEQRRAVQSERNQNMGLITNLKIWFRILSDLLRMVAYGKDYSGRNCRA